MNESLEELASLYVLDRLDPAEREAFAARLTHDAELAALVRSLEVAAETAIHALPAHSTPVNLLERIERQLDPAAPVAPEAAPAAKIIPFARSWTRYAGWGLAAVIALSLATLAVQSFRPRPVVLLVRLDATDNTRTELTLPTSTNDPDQRFVQLASLAEKYWETPTALPNATKASAGSYALVDSASRTGFVAVRGLPRLIAPQSYHLWSLDPTTGQVSDAGALPAAREAGGLYSFELPAEAAKQASRLKFFITVEHASDTPTLPSPRGRVVLGTERI